VGEADRGPRQDIEKVPDSDIVSDNSKGGETVENLKMNERYGNVYENKGPLWKTWGLSRNVYENKGT
jgi:hypothetical protein